MDYTLVHYRTEAWERAAFESALKPLTLRGWPVRGLPFDPVSVIQGLAFDLELGNLVKATRFGYIIQSIEGSIAQIVTEIEIAGNRRCPLIRRDGEEMPVAYSSALLCLRSVERECVPVRN